jgi:hypothetical protein
LDVRVDQLHASWDDQMATAAGVNARVLEAARQAGNAIRAAGRTSPTADQNWLEDAWEKGKRQVSGWVDDLKGFVAEHAEAVRSLAKALRVVGIALVVVGAVLAMLGVGTVVMTAGFVLWGASDALLAPKLQAVRNVLRLADSREALARAEQARAGLPGSDEFARKAVAADGEPTLSGWKQPRPDGFTHATPEAVRDYAQRIGPRPRTEPRVRPEPASGLGRLARQVPGLACREAAGAHRARPPDRRQQPMCSDCVEFFRRHAIHTGRPQIVTDPDGTRLFQPDGRIIPNPGPRDLGPAPPPSPQAPPSPDGVGRDGVMVGAAAGATAGWNIPGQEG